MCEVTKEHGGDRRLAVESTASMWTDHRRSADPRDSDGHQQ
ncbi:hypothetical protein [Natrialba asiatica]|nr:hypothetical protein [Natrialba asiatica]